MGTRFSLKDPNPGVWFVFDEADPNSGRVCVRVMNPAKAQEIAKATGRKRVEYRNGQRFEVTDTDEEKRSRMLWDYSIVSWERLEDDEGKPIECTTDNKQKLMLEHIGFAAFIGNCIDKLNAEYESRREAVEKNS